MKNKHVGFLIIGIALFVLLIVFSFNNALDEIVNTTCDHGMSCPMHVTLKTQKVISYGLMGLLFAIGIFIAFFMKDESIVLKEVERKPINKEEISKKIESLEDEEKNIMNIILRNEGSVYQSDLIKETKLTKVKVSRLLDKLEGKRLIERKRRGMTNIVILKS